MSEDSRPMESVLDTADTWFLESYRQGPYGALVIRVVEGIKGAERMPVKLDELTLSECFPVTIEPRSRCAAIVFDDVRALLTYTEGYDAEDPKMHAGQGRFVRPILGSSFRELAVAALTAIDDFRGEYSEWVVWTEEQIFQVLAGSPPEIRLEDRKPDFSIERGQTWYAR